MVLRDEDKLQVDGQTGAGGNKRCRSATVPAVSNGKDIPALDICAWQLAVGLAENV